MPLPPTRTRHPSKKGPVPRANLSGKDLARPDHALPVGDRGLPRDLPEVVAA